MEQEQQTATQGAAKGVTMKEMLEAGVHFGHQTARWNPKMKPYVFGARGGIYIIDLQKTVTLAQKAADFAKKISGNGGRMIFIGTKNQARETVKEAAEKCGQFYITNRWLGGTLTNFQTIKNNIDRLKRLEQMKEKDEYALYKKKEVIRMEKEREDMLKNFEGIKDMRELPAALFVVDLKKEHIAVEEANRLGLPVIGIADTNCDPERCNYPIPGNDDAIRSIRLFSMMIADAYNEGAVLWEQKLRAMTDKQADVEREAPARPRREDRPERSAPRTPGARGPHRGDQKDAAPAPGPQVVKRAPKKRTLVAAGTAEEIADLHEVATGTTPEAAEGTTPAEGDTTGESKE